MANTTIALKKSGTPAAIPSVLANGELAINYADGTIYYKNATGQIVSFSGGAAADGFGIVDVDGTLVLSSVGNDVLSFLSGNNITLSACTSTKTITFNSIVNIPVTNVAPVIAQNGDLWWNNDNGRLFIYYADGDSGQWIEANPSGETINVQSLISSDATGFAHANAAFDKANSANVLAFNTGIGANAYAVTVGASSNAWANSLSTIDRAIANSSANSAANSSNNYANASFYTIANGTAAFAKANAALANTTGTFNGSLTVSANLIANTLNTISGLIDFNGGSRPSYQQGRVYYDDFDKSLTLMNDTTDFKVPLGQVEFVRVWNNSGTLIEKGKPVYATGFHNTSHHHPTIALADASDPAKYDVLGLVASNIADVSHGYVITRGWIGGIDTSNLTQAERFHLGFASPGSLVTTSPEYPNYPFDIGYCVVSSNTNGYLYVDRQSHTQESIRVLNGARVGGDMVVEGDFTVLGTQTVTSTSSLSVGTQYIYLSAGDSIPNSNISFTGSGLNDLTFRGHYTGVSNTTFYVKITEANATGDYFTWSYNNFATNVASNVKILYQTNQLLSNGISAYFQSNTGHTIGATWNASATAVSTDSGFVTNHTDLGRYTHAGLFRDATDGTFKFFNSYDAEPAGNIDIANTTFGLGNVEVLKITAEQIFAGATEIGSLVPVISETANLAYSKANSANVLAFNTGIGANNWANTKLSNTAGISFAGDLYFPTGNIGIGTTSATSPLTIIEGTVTPITLVNDLIDASGNANSTVQLHVRNANTGTVASSDLIATADNGTDTTNYIDLGINGSNYAEPNWTINGKNDGYLYVSDSNLSIGTANSTSATKYINFFVGGIVAADEVMRIQDSAGGANVGIGRTNPGYKLDVNGTVNAAAVLVNGAQITGGSGTTLGAVVAAAIGFNLP